MGTWRFRADIVGDLFRLVRTGKFDALLSSDADLHVLNRRATIGLPSKAAASGAQLASSRENDAPCPSRRRPFFPKPRCARQVDQQWRCRGAGCSSKAGEQGHQAMPLAADGRQAQQAVTRLSLRVRGIGSDRVSC